MSDEEVVKIFAGFHIDHIVFINRAGEEEERDEIADEFLENFYTLVLDAKNICQAFDFAKRRVKKEYSDSIGTIDKMFFKLTFESNQHLSKPLG